MNTPWAERGVAVQNAAAVEWLAARGYSMDESTRSLHLFADEVAQSGFLLRRLWVSRLSATLRADENARDRFTAIFAFEGEALIDSHLTNTAKLGAGMLLLRQRTGSVRVDTDEPFAIMQIESEWDRLLGVDRVGASPIVAADGFGQIFGTMATAILNSSVTPGDGGFGYVRRAIESALSAVLIQSAQAPAEAIASTAQRELFRRATELIEASADDAEFSLSTMTERLAVSKTYLQRAFRAAGTTPLRYLQRVRAVNARALITSHAVTNRADLAHIARQSGFNTVETMKSVIARELGPDRDRR